jgi:hypothetical protein
LDYPKLLESRPFYQVDNQEKNKQDKFELREEEEEQEHSNQY